MCAAPRCLAGGVGNAGKYGAGVTVVEAVARVRVGSGVPVERLVCHPRLPLVAGLDSERPAVHVWDCGSGEPHELATVGASSTVYGDVIGWERAQQTPATAWHPDQPLLLVAGKGSIVRWTPAGLFELDGRPPTADYRSMAFSPDGWTLWASPSSRGRVPWEFADAIDLASGTVGTGFGWDTGIVVHPAGGLVATLRSDQGATLVLFARVDHEVTPGVMRVLRRALILDVDGYETPIFSPDGRHFAIRGNAYENSLEIFEFPSLNRVLATTLRKPNSSHPYPHQMRAWSRYNIAFGAQPGVLWIGTPTGALVEIDLGNEHVAEHDVLAGSPVTALGAVATGELIVATGEGDLVLVSLHADSAKARAAGRDTPQAAVAAFLDATSEVPNEGGLWKHLVMTDGSQTWEPADLAAVTTATTTDPIWLRIQAVINNANDANK